MWWPESWHALLHLKRIKDIRFGWNEKNLPRKGLFLALIWWISPRNVVILSWKFYHSLYIIPPTYPINFSSFGLSWTKIDFWGGALIKIITFLMKNCHKVVKKSKIMSQTQQWTSVLCVGQCFFPYIFISLYSSLRVLSYEMKMNVGGNKMRCPVSRIPVTNRYMIRIWLNCISDWTTTDENFSRYLYIVLVLKRY